MPHPAPTRLGVVVSDSDYGHSSHPVAGWQFPSAISIWLNLTATALTSACRHSNTRSTAGSPTTAALSTEGRVGESRDNHATGSLLVSLNLIIDDHEGVRDGQVDGGEASGLAERLASSILLDQRLGFGRNHDLATQVGTAVAGVERVDVHDKRVRTEYGDQALLITTDSINRDDLHEACSPTSRLLVAR